jgi:hypothetical protein
MFKYVVMKKRIEILKYTNKETLPQAFSTPGQAGSKYEKVGHDKRERCLPLAVLAVFHACGLDPRNKFGAKMCKEAIHTPKKLDV